MKTVLLTRHAETELEESGLYKVFSRIEQIVEQNYNVIRLKIGPWSARDLDAWLINNIQRTDLLITSYPYPLKVLRENGWQGKTIFKGLGGLPRGGNELRGALPYLYHSDVIWFNCTADLEIYKLIITHDGTQPETVCIPYGTDTQIYHPLKDSEANKKYRSSLGIKPEDFVLVYTGAVTIEKNVHSTIEAVAELRRLGYPVKFLIVGRIEDTPFSEFRMYPVNVEKKTTKHIETHGISSHVTILDWENDENTLNNILNASDVFVNLTLHHEQNFSLSQIEAMSAGLPGIVTAWGGLKDTIIHNKVGFSIDTWVTNKGIRFDAPAVLDALKCLIENKARYTEQSQSARTRSVEIYNGSDYAKHVKRLIEKTLEQPTLVTQPKLTDLGTRLNQRFVRKGYPLKYSKRTGPPKPTYDSLSDPDYVRLITPYTSRTEHKLESDSLLFCAMTGHLNGEYFVSEDLLYSIRVPLSAEEIEVINQLHRWQGVPRHMFKHSDELLISLIQKGLLGISNAVLQ